MEKSNSMDNNSMRRGVFSNNNKRMSPSGLASYEEESGWTTYFDDYFNEYNCNHDENNISSMISLENHVESSLISDAASSAAKKFAHHDHHQDHEQHVMGFSLDKTTCDRSSSLMMKKRKTKVVLLDESLEDTASSPANSPKVYDLMNQLDRQPPQKNIMDNSQEKASGSTSRKLKIDERSRYGSIKADDDNNGRDNDATGLKKKGLCLVPLSMLVNYLD